MRCPSCWAKEKWSPRTPDGMGWAHSERLLPWSSAFESLQESCGSLFSCKASRGRSYKVASVTYVTCFFYVTLLLMWHFLNLEWEKEKRVVEIFVKAIFLPLYHLFLLLFAVSSFHEFLLFSLLVYILCKQPPCPCELLIKVLQCT